MTLHTPARTTRLDGRELRSRQTRENIILAVRHLFGQGVVLPPVDVIARKAGCSKRTLFCHFPTIADLRMAAFTDAQVAAFDARLQQLSPRDRVASWLSQRLPAENSPATGTNGHAQHRAMQQ